MVRHRRARRSRRGGSAELPALDALDELTGALVELDGELDRAIHAAGGAPLSQAVGRALGGLTEMLPQTAAGDWLTPLFHFLYGRWWRVSVENANSVPDRGGTLLIVNRTAGGLPFDAAMLVLALEREHRTPRGLRPALDDEIFELPLVASWAARLSSIRGHEEIVERHLRRGDLVAVFVDVVRDGRRESGMDLRAAVEVARGAGAAVVPTAIRGVELSARRGARSARTAAASLRRVPGIGRLAALGGAGLLPRSSPWTIRFGDALAGAEVGVAAVRRTLRRLLADETTAHRIP